MTKLYYTPGACSLSPHIALLESGLPFSLEAVDLGAKKLKASGADYTTINPKGYVPALGLDDGQVITEGAIIVQWIADQVPGKKLAPAAGTLERVRLQEWLHFIATELHKGFGPINNPKSNDELRQVYRQRLDARFGILAAGVVRQPYLLGEVFTVADGYAYYVLRSLRKLDTQALAASAPLASYFDRLSSRPSIQAALKAENLT